MEEKLAVQPHDWANFLIEFPTLPKQLVEGREESQRVLFVCPVAEKNPTELFLALFGRQIVMQRLQIGESLEAGTRIRFAFLYAPDLPANPERMLSTLVSREDTVILLADKTNVVLTARNVMDQLTQPRAAAGLRTAGETGYGLLDAQQIAQEGEESIWDDQLPDIVLVDDEGNLVHATTNLGDYRAEYACRFVLAHYHENVNRDKMADMVHLSPGYFSNLFRSEVAMSFSDYLIMVRIENAKAMLRRFELSVEAISKKCGFNSLAHFSRTFKDRCGLSPLKYRKSPHVVS